MREVGIGIAGFGTVGGGVLSILERHARDIEARLGARIAVVATVRSTMQPSCALVHRKAREAGKTVEVVDYLVDGALDVLMQEKNREKHNALVLAAIRQAESECDVIVLAQGSMAALLPELAGIRKPVLTSPRLAEERAREMLRA